MIEKYQCNPDGARWRAIAENPDESAGNKGMAELKLWCSGSGFWGEGSAYDRRLLTLSLLDIPKEEKHACVMRLQGIAASVGIDPAK